jgi:hypothetical protein
MEVEEGDRLVQQPEIDKFFHIIYEPDRKIILVGGQEITDKSKYTQRNKRKRS